MKKGLIGMIVALALVSNVAFANGAQEKNEADKTYELKFAHIAAEDNIWNKAAILFKDEVEKNSNGRITVKIYPNNQLGSEKEVLQSIQTGTADLTITADSLSPWVPEIGFMGTPYLIDDYAHLDRVVDGEVGNILKKNIEEATGMKPIAWFPRGPRYLTTNKIVKTTDDLNDIIIRVPGVPMYVKTWDALGAKPVPMAFAEVFTGVQQGTINAQENPLSLIKSAGFYEVLKYIGKTEHVRGWIYVVIGSTKFNSLPADLQQVVLDAAQKMQSYEKELFFEDEKELSNFLIDHGMEFVDVDRKAFAEKATKGVLPLLTDEQRKLYDMSRALADK
jgi:tripartite ATP-independent transporter DctP family solute receptor